MRTLIGYLCMVLVLGVVLSGVAFAEPYDAYTFKDFEGVQPLTAEQIKSQLIQKGSVKAEGQRYSHATWFRENGTLRVEGCGRGKYCSSPDNGKGTWEVAEDGTFSFTLNWSSGTYKWRGKLYPKDGDLFMFFSDANDDSKWEYHYIKP